METDSKFSEPCLELEYVVDGREATPEIASEQGPRSNDPNDPLNWSKTTKALTYGTICLFTFIANVNGSNLTVAIVPLHIEFGGTVDRAEYLVCFNILFFGLGNLFWVPMMRVTGKRPVYLCSMALLAVSNVWSMTAHSYGSLLGSRILSGVAASAADATVPSVVTDMFSLQHRGRCMMFFHLALSSGLFIGPLISAYLVQLHSWRWSCGFIAITTGVIFVIAIFTVLETSYTERRIIHPEDSIPSKRNFWHRLSLTQGYNSNGSFLRTIGDILSIALYPPVLWVGFAIGVFIGWAVIVQFTAAQTFTRPPYSWGIGSLGLLSIAGWIGVLFAFYAGGPLIDFIANFAHRRQRTAIRRPEVRLIALIIPAVIGPMGLLTFAFTITHKTHWIGPAVGNGMQAFGLTAVSNIAVTYAVDCYQPLAGESLVTVFIIRNTIAVLASLFSSKWLQVQSILQVFSEMIGVQYFFLLLSIPLYFSTSKILKLTVNYGPMRRQVALANGGSPNV